MQEIKESPFEQKKKFDFCPETVHFESIMCPVIVSIKAKTNPILRHYLVFSRYVLPDMVNILGLGPKTLEAFSQRFY
jgi:hypothetical protein